MELKYSYVCSYCGERLDVNSEVENARVGQSWVHVTCTHCETVHTLGLEWTPRIVEGVEPDREIIDGWEPE